MNWMQELVDRYLAFYRPEYKRGIGYTARACLKPLNIASDVLMAQTKLSNDEMKIMIAAQITKLLDQIHSGTAEGRHVLNGNDEKAAIMEFARFFIDEFWVKVLNRDRARISGNKFSMIQNTCEFIVKGEMQNKFN